MNKPDSAAQFGALLRDRRSVRDFLPDPVSSELINALLADANQAPSWSNTQPYRLAVASGELTELLRAQLCQRFDTAMAAQQGGWLGKLSLIWSGGLPDGDFKVNFAYPEDLQPRRRATGHALYELLGVGRKDDAARLAQMRRNFEFFGAPTVIFVFVHAGLREFSVLDAGIWLQSLMLSAQAHGLATCAQGALATWAGPVREAFKVPDQYKLLCGVSLGYASEHPVNQFNPGRVTPTDLLLNVADGKAQ